MGRYRLIEYAAVFDPADPPRSGRMVFFRPVASMGAPEKVTVPEGAVLGERETTVVRARGDGVRSARAPYWWMSIDAALPVLARSRLDSEGDDSCQFWGAASLFALQLLARGRLFPDVTAAGFDTWRSTAHLPDEQEYFDVLAESMPPQARALPFGANSYPLSVPERSFLLGAFLDAAADSFARTPGGSGAYAVRAPQHVPHLTLGPEARPAGAPVSVQISLRLEIEDIGDTGVRAVVQVQDVDPPRDLVDAGALWRRPAPPGSSDAARKEGTLVALRGATRAWSPLERLLDAAVPDALEVRAEEVDDLFGDAVDDLIAAGCAVHWPRDLVRSLTMRAVLGPKTPGAAPSGRLGPDALLGFRWQAALGKDGDLTEGEMDRLAEAKRPFVRLRDQWVRVDAAVLRKARRRKIADLAAFDAVAAALTGQTEVEGEVIEVEPAGWLATLRTVLTSPVPETVPPDALAGTLRPYQRHGLSWMQQLTSNGLGCCLADDMGLGKTITLIALHLARQETGATRGPTLVVCPASLLGNWEREVSRFAPATGVRRFHGPGRTPDGLDEAGFVLTTYGTARLDAERLAGVDWSLVVLDEAQHVKNAASSTARALRKIPSRGRVALTGTPVENNLSELWSVLDWATPGLLGPLKAFRTRFAKPIEARRDPAATAELATLIRPFVLRRRKSDPGIAPELPPKTETSEFARLTREQAVLYEAVVRETMAKIEAAEGIARRGLVLKLLTSLRQICNHPAQYLKEADSPRLAGRSGKFDLFEDLLSVMLAEQQSVLVFTQYVEMARLVSAHLGQQHIDHRILHGGTPVAGRPALVDAFQSGDFKVFLLSLRAAGTGLTLTRAQHVVFLDQWWNPAVMGQAADRAYRIGTRHPVQVHSLISEGTVEERIAELLAAKKDLADSVLSDVSSGLTELNDEELFDLIALRSSG
ncbi:DEAD/DEAH box helicase [Streptomyces sp. MNU77]|uniref:DEAD/DEAH box helicase n=1 Tax=Streptomyces sp. MNU77 TaxID=1573406 RepID=UPI000B31C4BD|nr:DEAD/DEAH box helicase [Streptomyces sp. MNU77]